MDRSKLNLGKASVLKKVRCIGVYGDLNDLGPNMFTGDVRGVAVRKLPKQPYDNFRLTCTVKPWKVDPKFKGNDLFIGKQEFIVLTNYGDCHIPHRIAERIFEQFNGLPCAAVLAVQPGKRSSILFLAWMFKHEPRFLHLLYAGRLSPKTVRSFMAHMRTKRPYNTNLNYYRLLGFVDGEIGYEVMRHEWYVELDCYPDAGLAERCFRVVVDPSIPESSTDTVEVIERRQ